MRRALLCRRSLIVLRGALTFLVTLALVRLRDKRLVGKGTACDLAVAIMIGSVMSRSITGSSPLIPTWVTGPALISSVARRTRGRARGSGSVLHNGGANPGPP